MNMFLERVIKLIKLQTGATDTECKIAFDKTKSIQGAIQYIRAMR